MTLKQRLLGIQEVALCLCRKWWRPLLLLNVAAATFVNLVYLPVIHGKPADLAQAAAWIAACGALSWVREWGKSKGNTE